jgi:hypothetical protein
VDHAALEEIDALKARIAELEALLRDEKRLVQTLRAGLDDAIQENAKLRELLTPTPTYVRCPDCRVLQAGTLLLHVCHVRGMAPLPTMTRIEIDPNRRTKDGCVPTSLDNADGLVRVGDAVVAYEPEGGCAWDAVVEATMNDGRTERGFARLRVDWDSYRDEPTDDAPDGEG